MGVDIGAEVSLGPLDIMAHMDARFESMAHDLQKTRQDINAARAKVPVDVRKWAGGVIPTPTVRSVLSLGGPETGSYWLVRRIVTGGLTFKTAAAGTGEVYVSGLAFTEGVLSSQTNMVNGLQLIDLVDEYTALPAHTLYSNEQIIVQEGENLLVLLDSASAGQFYSAAAQVRQFRRITTTGTTEG